MKETKYRRPIGPIASSLPERLTPYDADKLISDFDQQFQEGLAAFQRGDVDEKYGVRVILDEHRRNWDD